MRRRPVAAAVAGLLLAGPLLVGCGEGDDGPPEASSSSPAATDGATDATDATDETTATADPEDPAYLPTPDGSPLTAPGTELAFGDPALAAWEPRQELVAVVDVRVLRAERTTVRRSLAGYRIDPADARSTPYFVTLGVGNAGDTDLGGRQLPVYAVDSEQRLVPPTGIGRGFAPCPGSSLPAVFAPGDRARSCLIFLVQRGATLEQVMFRPPEGVVPLTWSGAVTELGARVEDRGDRDRGTPRGGGAG